MYKRDVCPRSDLTAFNVALFDSCKTPFSLSVTSGEWRLGWPGLAGDVAIFQRLVELVLRSDTLSDEEFTATVIPQVERVVRESTIFTALKDPHIRVSNGHRGTTPYVHTMRTLESLATEHIVPVERSIVRLADLYHDAGKGSSAGLSGSFLARLQQRYDHAEHSHPAHQIVSAMLLGELLSSQHSAMLVSELGPTAAQQVFELVLNHHFWGVAHDRATNQASLPALLNELHEDQVTEAEWQILSLVYLFSRADIGATQRYHYFWPQQVEFSLEIMQFFWPEWSEALKFQYLKMLGLPEIY